MIYKQWLWMVTWCINYKYPPADYWEEAYEQNISS